MQERTTAKLVIAAGVSQAQLARAFGIGTTQMNRIINGQSWHREVL